jgi:hypothetical protein
VSQAPWQSGGAWGCDGGVRERTEKASQEEALPVADGEEVAGGFRASFRGRRLEEVLHTVVVLKRTLTVAQVGSTPSGAAARTVGSGA